jgi:SAM-dependent methyltransferase
MSGSEFFLLPRLTDLTERLSSTAAVRQRVAEAATGHVLELAPQRGVNLYLYPRGITSLTTLVPTAAAAAIHRRHARHLSFPIDTREGLLPGLPVKDHAFDCVVSTFVLSTTPAAEQVLREIRRVLKPGGRLLFAEYGLARDEAVAMWQRRLAPVHRAFGGVAQPPRYIDDAIVEADFNLKHVTCSYLARLPRALGCVYEGIAFNDH